MRRNVLSCISPRGESRTSAGPTRPHSLKHWLPLILFVAFAAAAEAQDSSVRLPLNGHVLPALANATAVTGTDAALAARPADQPLTLTVVLRRNDADGFARYLNDVYDQNSPLYRQFLTPKEVTERFGPTQSDYDAVVQYFTQRGFAVGEGSLNRMTVTLNGTRGGAEQALAVSIGDYKIGARSFYANSNDPTLPANIASRVEAIAGLSNLAQPTARPQPLLDHLPDTPFNRGLWYALCANEVVNGGASAVGGQAAITWAILFPADAIILNLLQLANSLYSIYQAADPGKTGVYQQYSKCVNQYNKKYGYGLIGGGDPPPPAWQAADGTGQTIGVVAFDTFLMSDVADYIALVGQPSGPITNVSQVHVNGGATLGANQDEVLLDITDILTTAPGAHIAVYDAPFTGSGTSFQGIFNAMIGGGVTIISNSWSYCEDQTTLADVNSIDTIFQTAAASGISAFNASGDSGTTCLDGSPNTAGVPATSPHATAVGGTSLQLYPGMTYGKETWWDSSASTPPGGKGGYGVSRFFSRPAYQNGLTTSTARSIPDVAANADPAYGVKICQASAGGCPTGSLYGGTSSSTPMWAAFAAMLNQTQGSNLGAFNPLIYPFANTNAFHNAASMGSDFAHVGLGSPNLAQLHRHLTGQAVGPVSPTVSSVHAFAQTTFTPPQGSNIPLPSYADGVTQTYIVVTLADSNGVPLGGRNVTLSGGPGSHAVFYPTVLATDVDSGIAIFFVTDTTAETITVTATDTTNAIVLPETPKVQFFSPPAASGNIVASVTSIPVNFFSPIALLTITLHDSTGAGAAGKVISISQGGGHSIVTAQAVPGSNTPGITDANGVAVFNVFDATAETVVYTATDVTDSNLVIPGPATITFTGSTTSCAGPTPVAAAGFALSPFITGFFAGNFTYGNVNWNGCPGATSPTFTTSASVFAGDFRTGNLYRLGLNGGTVTTTNQLSSIGLTLSQPVFGKDGRLYATHGSNGSSLGHDGDIAEIDPVTGLVLRIVAANLTCPNGLAVDPLSGDLFFDNECSGAGFDDPNIYRISDPANTPVKSTYATLTGPGFPNGYLAFSPDGTLYVVSSYNAFLPAPAPIIRIDGTNKTQPAAMAPVPGVNSYFFVTVGEANADGSAKSLIVDDAAGLELVDLATNTHTLLVTGGIGASIIGPDGCVYAATSDTIYKLTSSDGSCGFVPTNPQPALKISPTTPLPAQGTTQTLTATFTNVTTTPTGTPVTFTIDGVNAQLKLGTTDAAGVATISYVGALAGVDTVLASGTAGTLSLLSNPATVTWIAGKHVSSVGLSGAPSAVSTCGIATLTASLTDVSVSPLAAIAGASIHFDLGAQSCNAITNAQGVASCTLLPTAHGVLTMTASFAGNASYAASSASQAYDNPNAAVVPGAPPLVNCAASRKAHGSAGIFDLPLAP
jgi:Pro-kumamolisin, activation domain